MTHLTLVIVTVVQLDFIFFVFLVLIWSKFAWLTVYNLLQFTCFAIIFVKLVICIYKYKKGSLFNVILNFSNEGLKPKMIWMVYAYNLFLLLNVLIGGPSILKFWLFTFLNFNVPVRINSNR